ncbi:MAG: cation:proton antiporter [Candidatus Paceibacterota bacterium]
MHDFLPFFLIVFAGVLFSVLSIRTHIPWAVMLVVGGVIVGPSVLGVVEVTTTIDFLGQVGLIFLMFMAGLETRLSQFREFKSGLALLAFLNGFLPFLVGFGIIWLLGYSLTTAIIVGIIFISSSIAVVIPSLTTSGMLNTKLGQSVVITTVLQDITSLALLSLVLQLVSPVTEVPLYVFYPVLLGVLMLLRFAIPKVRDFLLAQAQESPTLFQLQFRVTFLILIGTVIFFELLGLHPIVAGFFSGLVLAESITSKILKDKIQTISYGIFIPVFFIVVGLQTDLSAFAQVGSMIVIMLSLIVGLVISKYGSGWLAARLVGFSPSESHFFAATSLPQLSTTLGTGFVAFQLGLLDQTLLTSLVMLSVVTVTLSPFLINRYSAQLIAEKG